MVLLSGFRLPVFLPILRQLELCMVTLPAGTKHGTSTSGAMHGDSRASSTGAMHGASTSGAVHSTYRASSDGTLPNAPPGLRLVLFLTEDRCSHLRFSYNLLP